MSKKELTLDRNLKMETEKINLVISKKLDDKINFLCKNISEVEWSGILLYHFSGSIDKPESMVVYADDLIPMNKGGKTYTEFGFTEKARDVDGFKDRHIEYCEEDDLGIYKKIGLIHSHNSMDVFFSSTDWGELIGNSPSNNIYLSLIVNNAGDRIAKICTCIKSLGQEVKIPLYTKNHKGEYIQMGEEIIEPYGIKNFIVHDCEIHIESEYDVNEDEFFINSYKEIIKKV